MLITDSESGEGEAWVWAESVKAKEIVRPTVAGCCRSAGTISRDGVTQDTTAAVSLQNE